MSAVLTVDMKKYARLANRVGVKAVETEDEYDRMVEAVEELLNKGGSTSPPRSRRFWKLLPSSFRILTIATTRCQNSRHRKCSHI